MEQDRSRYADAVIPLPNPGEGGPVYDGSSDATPVIPLPNPGEGGPVYSGGTPVVTYPSTTITSVAALRFLNAVSGYPPFQLYVDGTLAASLPGSGDTSGYVRVRAGRRLISVRGLNGYTYAEQILNFPAGSTSTVAVVGRTGGLSITRIPDACRIV